MNGRNLRIIGVALAILTGAGGAGIGLMQAAQGGKAAGYAEAERAVTKAEQEWFAIQQANDWARLSKMISDDFVIVDSDGSLGNRDSMIGGYKEEAPRVISLKMQVLVAHAVAANAVIASGLDDIATKGRDGGAVHRYERFIDTWILRDGRWQCVAEQITLSKPEKR
ncbi:MAG TPA: nuclear transport factor 2 family protein [Candidatus Acidoferrum sp.]